MTEQQVNEWIEQILADKMVSPITFKVAYLMARDFASGEPISLMRYERAGLAHRRSCQRAFRALEWRRHVSIAPEEPTRFLIVNKAAGQRLLCIKTVLPILRGEVISYRPKTWEGNPIEIAA